MFKNLNLVFLFITCGLVNLFVTNWLIWHSILKSPLLQKLNLSMLMLTVSFVGAICIRDPNIWNLGRWDILSSTSRVCFLIRTQERITHFRLRLTVPSTFGQGLTFTITIWSSKWSMVLTRLSSLFQLRIIVRRLDTIGCMHFTGWWWARTYR